MQKENPCWLCSCSHSMAADGFHFLLLPKPLISICFTALESVLLWHKSSFRSRIQLFDTDCFKACSDISDAKSNSTSVFTEKNKSMSANHVISHIWQYASATLIFASRSLLIFVCYLALCKYLLEAASLDPFNRVRQTFISISYIWNYNQKSLTLA